jgi:hypothetical protein
LMVQLMVALCDVKQSRNGSYSITTLELT